MDLDPPYIVPLKVASAPGSILADANDNKAKEGFFAWCLSFLEFILDQLNVIDTLKEEAFAWWLIFLRIHPLN